MNKLTIIGNLTRDPELRTTQSGVNVCSFTVAVNRAPTRAQREAGQQPPAKFFRVTAWRELGDNCAKYLAKGRKVAVTGSVRVRTYQASDGSTRAAMAAFVRPISPAKSSSLSASRPCAASTRFAGG